MLSAPLSYVWRINYSPCSTHTWWDTRQIKRALIISTLLQQLVWKASSQNHCQEEENQLKRHKRVHLAIVCNTNSDANNKASVLTRGNKTSISHSWSIGNWATKMLKKQNDCVPFQGEIRLAKHGCESNLVVVSVSVAPKLDKCLIRTTLYVANWRTHYRKDSKECCLLGQNSTC